MLLGTFISKIYQIKEMNFLFQEWNLVVEIVQAGNECWALKGSSMY